MKDFEGLEGSFGYNPIGLLLLIALGALSAARLPGTIDPFTYWLNLYIVVACAIFSILHATIPYVVIRKKEMAITKFYFFKKIVRFDDIRGVTTTGAKWIIERKNGERAKIERRYLSSEGRERLEKLALRIGALDNC